MAVYSDVEKIRKAMEESKANHPQLRWVKQIAISYSSEGIWTATFDSDLTVMFDDVEYSSNTIYFIMHDWSLQKLTDECYCRECTRKRNAKTDCKH